MYGVTINTGHILGLMYASFPVHTVAALVAVQEDFIAIINGFTITACHTDDAVAFSFEVQPARSVAGFTAIIAEWRA